MIGNQTALKGAYGSKTNKTVLHMNQFLLTPENDISHKFINDLPTPGTIQPSSPEFGNN